MKYLPIVFISLIFATSCHKKIDEFKEKGKNLQSFSIVKMERDAAQIQARKGNFKEAFWHIDKALKQSPGDKETLITSAIIRAAKHDYNLSLSELNKVVSMDKNYAPALVARSTLYYNTDRFKLAKEDIDKAIKLDKSFALAYVNRSAINGRLERFESALPTPQKPYN